MRRLVSYFRARIREQSTIAAISAVIPTAVQLASPWCWLVILGAAAVALMPTSAPTNPNSTGASQ